VAPTAIARAIVAHKQSADLHTGALSQLVAHRLLGDPGFLPGHLDQLRRTYRTQADALTAALEHHLGDRIDLPSVRGGMFVWARILDAEGRAIDADALLPEALAHGTAFVPASAFVVDVPVPGAVRLSFATVDTDDLHEAARRLAAACASVAAR
jgi:2-aminoadipate transaminase